MNDELVDSVVDLVCNLAGVVTATAGILVVVGYLGSAVMVKKSEQFLELRPGLERQCREMLNMGNTTPMVQGEAQKFNEVLADFKQTLAHPVWGYTVSPKVLFVKPLTCGLE